MICVGGNGKTGRLWLGRKSRRRGRGGGGGSRCPGAGCRRLVWFVRRSVFLATAGGIFDGDRNAGEVGVHDKRDSLRLVRHREHLALRGECVSRRRRKCCELIGEWDRGNGTCRRQLTRPVGNADEQVR